MRRTRENRRAAFTMMELLLALGIIIILTVISVPALGPMLGGSSVDGAAGMLKGALMHARYSAVAERRQALCWAFEGSSYEMGSVSLSGAATVGVPTDMNILLGWTTDGVNRAAWYTESSGWTRADTDGCPDTPTTTRRVSPVGVASHWAQWTFTLPPGEGDLNVYVWYRAHTNRTDAAYYDVKRTKTETTTYGPRSQKTGGDQWLPLGTCRFTVAASDDDGVRSVKVRANLASSTYLASDSVKIAGTYNVIVSMPANEFVDSQQAWEAGQWNGYRVTWVSSDGLAYTRTIRTSGGIVDGNKVVVDTDWSPPPEIGAPYLIAPTSPTAEPTQPFTVGSGTTRDPSNPTDAGSMRWDKLPEFAAVFPYRIEGTSGHGTASSELAFPIMFTSTGRACLPNDYVTIRIYDRQEPNDRSRWRYVRVYRNTGRVVVGRTLDDLN